MSQWRSEDDVLFEAAELQNGSILKSWRTAKGSDYFCEPERRQGFCRKREDIGKKKMDRNEICLLHNSAQGHLCLKI